MPQELNECILQCTKLYSCIVLHYTIHENEDTQVAVLHMYQCFKQNVHVCNPGQLQLQIFISLLYKKKKKRRTLLDPLSRTCVYPGPFFSFAPILPLYRCCFLLPWVLEVLLLSREGKVSHDTNSLQSSCIKCTRSKFPAEALKDITQIN